MELGTTESAPSRLRRIKKTHSSCFPYVMSNTSRLVFDISKNIYLASIMLYRIVLERKITVVSVRI